jgi:predicted dehydrogenase
VAAEFGIPRWFDDVEAMCADEGVDAVVVVVPPAETPAVVEPALAAGKPVFVEKPAATTSAEARRLAELAARLNVPVQVGYMKRFAPAYVRLREAISRPEFGLPSLVHVRWAMGPFGGTRPLDDWLTENAVHAIDLAAFLVGPLRNVRATVSRPEGEHVVLATAEAAGTLVSLQLTTTGPWWHDNEFVEVFGHGYAARVENATVFRLRPPDGPEERWSPNFTILVERNLTNVLLGFVPELRAFAALRPGDASECDLGVAADALEVVEAILQARA